MVRSELSFNENKEILKNFTLFLRRKYKFKRGLFKTFKLKNFVHKK